jgi:hypothetical protein
MTTTKAGPIDSARSEDEIFAPGGPTITLVLGGVSKPIRQLPVRANEEWKRKLAEVAATRFGGLSGAPTVDAIAKLFNSLGDVQAELLIAYDVDGRLGGAEWIGDHATPGELWQAFKDVLEAVFPFLADAKRAPNLVAEILPQLVALLSSSASQPGAEGSTS